MCLGGVCFLADNRLDALFLLKNIFNRIVLLYNGSDFSLQVLTQVNGLEVSYSCNELLDIVFVTNIYIEAKE